MRNQKPSRDQSWRALLSVFHPVRGGFQKGADRIRSVPLWVLTFRSGNKWEKHAPTIRMDSSPNADPPHLFARC